MSGETLEAIVLCAGFPLIVIWAFTQDARYHNLKWPWLILIVAAPFFIWYGLTHPSEHSFWLLIASVVVCLQMAWRVFKHVTREDTRE